MSKLSTRRAVSFRAEVFERARRYCQREGIPLARWMEIVITSALDAREVAKLDRETAVAAVTSARTNREAELEAMRKAAFG